MGHRYAKSKPMPTDQPDSRGTVSETARDRASEKRRPPAAERALAEAAARRAERERSPAGEPKEAGGRGGPDPTRYGDWEVNGLASDF
jgi:hypothetical protein